MATAMRQRIGGSQKSVALWKGDAGDRQIFAAIVYTHGFDKYMQSENLHKDLLGEDEGEPDAYDRIPQFYPEKVDGGLDCELLAGLLMFGDLELMTELANEEIKRINREAPYDAVGKAYPAAQFEYSTHKLKPLSSNVLVDEAVFVEPSDAPPLYNKLPEVDEDNRSITARVGFYKHGMVPVLRNRTYLPDERWRLLDVHEYNLMRVLRNTIFNLRIYDKGSPCENPELSKKARRLFNGAVREMQLHLETNFTTLSTIFDLNDIEPRFPKSANPNALRWYDGRDQPEFGERRLPAMCVAWGVSMNAITRDFPTWPRPGQSRRYWPRYNRRYRSTTFNFDVTKRFSSAPIDNRGRDLDAKYDFPPRDYKDKGCCINFAVLHPDVLAMDVRTMLNEEELQIYAEEELLLHSTTRFLEIDVGMLTAQPYKGPMELAFQICSGRISGHYRDEDVLPLGPNREYNSWVVQVAKFVAFFQTMEGIPLSTVQRDVDLVYTNYHNRWHREWNQRPTPDTGPRIGDWYKYRLWVCVREAFVPPAGSGLTFDPNNYTDPTAGDDAVFEAINAQREEAEVSREAKRNNVTSVYRVRKRAVQNDAANAGVAGGFLPGLRTTWVMLRRAKFDKLRLSGSRYPANEYYALTWKTELKDINDDTPRTSVANNGYFLNEVNPQYQVTIRAWKKEQERLRKERTKALFQKWKEERKSRVTGRGARASIRKQRREASALPEPQDDPGFFGRLLQGLGFMSEAPFDARPLADFQRRIIDVHDEPDERSDDDDEAPLGADPLEVAAQLASCRV